MERLAPWRFAGGNLRETPRGGGQAAFVDRHVNVKKGKKKKGRVSDSKGSALPSMGWKCPPSAKCLQNAQQESGGAEQRPG